MPDRRGPGDHARRAGPALRRQGHRPARPARPPQRSDRPVHQGLRRRRGRGARGGTVERRSQCHGTRLRGRLQPLPRGPRRPAARSLRRQGLGRADDAGRIPAQRRDRRHPARHGLVRRRDTWCAAAFREGSRQPGAGGDSGGGGPRPAGAAGLVQRLGLRPRQHRRRPRPAAGQSALPVEGHQPLLADARHHSGQAGRDGGDHRQFTRRGDRLQQGRGLEPHRLHRQAFHAARAEAGRWRSDQLPRRRTGPRR